MKKWQAQKQKVKEITDKLEEGLKELFESKKYKNYLSTMSKFHNYSFNNTLLIAMQKPEATLVAGCQAWQKNFNRYVNKGERGIRILASAPYKIKEERDKLDPVTGEVMLDKDGMPQTEEVEIETSPEKSKITNLCRHYSEFLGFKLKLEERPKQNDIVSRMSDKAKKKAIAKLRKAIWDTPCSN